MPKGNPNPVQTEDFKKKRFQPFGEVPGDYPLGKKVWGIRLPTDVEEVLKNLNNKKRVEFMRKILTEAVRSDLMN